MSGFVLPEMLVRSAGMGGVTRWELIHCLLEGALADFFFYFACRLSRLGGLNP